MAKHLIAQLDISENVSPSLSPGAFMNSLNGFGFVAIWNGIAPAYEADFKEWHEQEHMPERLAIPGFEVGMRWRAELSQSDYFTLYLLESPSVASSAAYVERLNAPTSWTRRVTARFTGNARCVGQIVWSSGEPSSSRIVAVQINNEIVETGLKEHCERIMAIPGVIGCHYGRSDTVTTAISTVERQGRTVSEPAGMVVIALDGDEVSGLDSEHLTAALPSQLAREAVFFHRELVMPRALS
ncbi:hypothetical protein [Devosia crocina]|nr:hypothetical protein [Devosia crocina]